jgi:hypothetical protein
MVIAQKKVLSLKLFERLGPNTISGGQRLARLLVSQTVSLPP